MNKIEYEPLIQGDFSARTVPAKVSKESDESLIKNGYVMIGTARAQFITKTYEKGKFQAVAGPSDATATVLEKAAAQGGDTVVLLQDNESEWETQWRKECVSPYMPDLGSSVSGYVATLLPAIFAGG